MASFSKKNGGGKTFTPVGSAIVKSGRVKIGKNGKQYVTIGFSDDTVSPAVAYTVTVCLNSYTPTASNAKYPNQDCNLFWVQKSLMK